MRFDDHALTSSRRAAAALVLLLLVVLASSAPGAAAVPRAVPPDPSPTAATGTTVTGGQAWNPKTKSFFGEHMSVTVEQTSDLVSQVVHVTWHNFTPSENANTDAVLYPVRIYQCIGAEVTSLAGCFSTVGYQQDHPDATNIAANTNMVITSTGPSGAGTADFTVLTGADEPTLGCNRDSPCSIVVEPGYGGDSFNGNCKDHSGDSTGDNPWASRYGGYWDRDPSCSWQNRIVIPLEFEPTPDDCPAGNTDFDTEGAPLISRALDSWRPGICRTAAGSRGLLVGYTENGEYQARRDFDAGRVDVALTNQPATDVSRPHAYAPLAISGIAVAYYVDNPETLEPITGMRLTARLLAKMLTQSYPGVFNDCQGSYPCAKAIAGNPTTVFDDPEFRQLNPGFKSLAGFTDDGNSFPSVVFGDSDLTYELTSWIAADPDAAAFLSGQPDPWGMIVNPAYLPGTAPRYPITQFTANDPGATKEAKYNCGAQDGAAITCVTQGIQSSWFPVSGVHNVAKLLLAGKVTARVPEPNCPAGLGVTNGTCDQHAATPAMPPGTRAAFAIVSAADAAAYRFPVAQLQTGSGTFAGPSTRGMSLAAREMPVQAKSGTSWPDFETLHDPDAYPLTAVTYAMVPTCGAEPQVATAISDFLEFAASDGAQVYGTAPGRLAPGYVALPDTQRARTISAAQAVRAQQCPPTPRSSTPVAPGTSPGTGPASSPGGATNPAPSGGGGPAPSPAPGAPSGAPGGPGAPGAGPDAPLVPVDASGPASGTGSVTVPVGGPSVPAGGVGPSTAVAPAPSGATAVSYGRPSAQAVGLPGVVVPIVLIGGAVLLVAGPALYTFGRVRR